MCTARFLSKLIRWKTNATKWCVRKINKKRGDYDIEWTDIDKTIIWHKRMERQVNDFKSTNEWIIIKSTDSVSLLLFISGWIIVVDKNSSKNHFTDILYVLKWGKKI